MRPITNMLAMIALCALLALIAVWIVEQIPHARNGSDLEVVLAGAPR